MQVKVPVTFVLEATSVAENWPDFPEYEPVASGPPAQTLPPKYPPTAVGTPVLLEMTRAAPSLVVLPAAMVSAPPASTQAVMA